MEGESCRKNIDSHAASLLASLNLQRERALLCDCVVRQRENPGQLYPAHRCVLAASSPVLATLLSSTGALVELQSPSLCDSVLELLLDYIYTGILPYTHSQQQYYSLLTAACHLEMYELQEALKHWQQTKTNNAHNTNGSTGSKRVYCSVSDSGISTVSSSNGVQENARLPLDIPVEDRRSLCVTRSAEDQERTGARRRQQLLKSEDNQTKRKEDDKTRNHCVPLLVSTSLPQGSPSSPASLRCGAVPVICHSSRAAMQQLAEVSSIPSYHPVDQTSASSSSGPVSQSAGTDNDSIVKHIAANKDNYGEQREVYSTNGDHAGTQDLCYKSSADQSAVVKTNYSSQNVDNIMMQNEGFMSSGLPRHTDHYTHSFQKECVTKNPKPDSVLEKKKCSDFISGLKYKNDLRFDDHPFKHQPLESSESQEMSVEIEIKPSTHSKDPRTSVPFTVEDSCTGSDSHSEDFGRKRQAGVEHSYSSRSADEMDGQDGHCGPKTDWYLNSHELEAKDAAYWQNEKGSENRGASMIDESCGADVCLHASTTQEASLHHVSSGLSASGRRSRDFDQILNIEITEQHDTTATDSNMTDPTYADALPSYHGHLYCLSQKDAYFTHKDYDRKHAYTCQPAHFTPDHSDQSSDEEEAGIFTSPGHRQHFTTETANQVLLLDISTKPAELPVLYEHRCLEGEKGASLSKNDTNGTGSNDMELRNEAAFTEEAGKSGAEFGADRYDKAWVQRLDAKGIKSGTDQSRDESPHKGGPWNVEAVSSSKEGENQNRTVTICTLPSAPDCGQASMSSTLSVCIPSTLSLTMPTNISAHLSTPVHHPFQCSLCDRSFSQRGSLNRHVRSHLGVRPFPCPRCPMTFSRQYRVTEHMRVHERCVLRSDFQKPPASSI